MNKKILDLLIGMLAVIMLATSMVGTVMAIGPLKALEVGNNPKLGGSPAMSVVMIDDAGPNNIAFMNFAGLIVNNADARKGEGRMNNAIIADIDIVFAIRADQTLYENKWVYLSGTEGEQWDHPTDDPDKGTHGMWYWTILPMFGPIFSAMLEQEYSAGVFAKRNLVGN